MAINSPYKKRSSVYRLLVVMAIIWSLGLTDDLYTYVFNFFLMLFFVLDWVEVDKDDS